MHTTTFQIIHSREPTYLYETLDTVVVLPTIATGRLQQFRKDKQILPTTLKQKKPWYKSSSDGNDGTSD